MPRSILTVFDDPDAGPRLKQLGITEHALMTYAVRCGEGMDKKKAFAMLMAGRNISEADLDFVLSVVDSFPV